MHVPQPSITWCRDSFGQSNFPSCCSPAVRMAVRYFTRVLLILHVTCLVLALPTVKIARKSQTGEHEEQLTGQETPKGTPEAKSGHDAKDQPTVLTFHQQTEKILRSAALLQADSLQLFNMAAEPIMNTTRGIPAILVKKAANLASSEELHRLESFGEEAKSAMHEQVVVPVENLVTRGVDELRNIIAPTLDTHQLAPLFQKLSKYLMSDQESVDQGSMKTPQLRLSERNTPSDSHANSEVLLLGTIGDASVESYGHNSQDDTKEN